MQPKSPTIHMRCCRLLFITFLLYICLPGDAQSRDKKQLPNVTLSAKNVSLAAVFKQIQRQAGILFFYNNTEVDEQRIVSVDFRNSTIQEVMNVLLDRLKYTWSFDKAQKAIIIKKISSDAADVSPKSDTSTISTINVSGSVSDEKGSPLPGATVLVKGTQQGTQTNEKGNFMLPDVRIGAVLLVRSIGFETREIRARGLQPVSVRMKAMVNGLDETVVIAYGTTTKRYNTGNVSTVKAEEIAKQPVSNPLLALQGRVPGLFITQNTGVPGGGITVRVQGQNSLSRGNDPLYVIDGVPYVSQMLPNLGYGILGDNGNTNGLYAPAGGGNPLSFINPADIESIEVLKDADATSIYGSRAAAGAILITTKKGKAGKTKIDINVQQGWGKITRMLDLLNTQQYLQMRHEAKLNDNAAIRPTDYDINGTWDTTRFTDWQKVLLGGTAHYTNAQASISGGNANTQFLLTAGYRRETTVFPGSLADKKGSLHFSLSHTSSNQRFRLQFSGNYLVDNNNLINSDLTGTAIALAPVAPALYNGDGTLNWAQLSDGTSSWYNPLAYLMGEYNLKVNNLTSSATISYEIIPGLNAKSSFGYTNMQSNEVNINPLGMNAPELRAFTPRYSNFSNGNIQSYIVEPQLSYQHKLFQGALDILIGGTFLENNTNQQQFNAIGFNSDLVMKDIHAASAVSVVQSLASTYRYSALFGRINYNWQNRYILNLTARRDGSSRFGPRNLFHNFGSVAGAWIISNEEFFKRSLPVVSFAKLRASYGTTGNDQIGEYQFMSLYGPVSVPTAYQQATGILPTGLSNPYLQWEETRKLQFGLDIGVLRDRVLLNINFYRNRSSNQLLAYALPYLAGFASIQQNIPAIIQNTGWEISLNTSNFNQSNFSWSSSVNITVPRNKLIAYPNLENTADAETYVIGKPIIDARKVFSFAGVDPTTGLFTFIGKDGHPTSNPVFPDDQTVFASGAPSYYGGFQNNFQYKGFELDILFQFVRQKGLDYRLGNRPGAIISRNDGTVRANQPVSVMDRWQKPGDNKSFQKFSAHYPSDVATAYVNAGLSDMTFSDASYIRLKNLSLSWKVPDSWKRSVHLTDAKIYVQGQNLLTKTNYIGLDPETRSLQNIPPLKVWTIGAQLSF